MERVTMSCAWPGHPSAQEGKHLQSLDQPRHTARAVKEKTARIRSKRKLFCFLTYFTVILL